MNPKQIAEAFHLAFLAVLPTNVDRRTFALKGGGNLRFYFDSLRFSEDIDLDVFVRDPRLFTQKIERTFASPALSKLLATTGISISYLNPKDRSTTKEKWVVGLIPAETRAMVYTKVELSHRAYGLEEYVEIRPIPAKSVSPYPPLPSPTVGHYVPRGAVIQKISALRGRGETQPRDVFDLDHLVRRFPDAPAKGLVDSQVLDQAASRVYEISFAEYRAKVVTFLEDDVQATFDSSDVWGQMQVRVVEMLEAMKR